MEQVGETEIVGSWEPYKWFLFYEEKKYTIFILSKNLKKNPRQNSWRIKNKIEYASKICLLTNIIKHKHGFLLFFTQQEYLSDFLNYSNKFLKNHSVHKRKQNLNEWFCSDFIRIKFNSLHKPLMKSFGNNSVWTLNKTIFGCI